MKTMAHFFFLGILFFIRNESLAQGPTRISSGDRERQALLQTIQRIRDYYNRNQHDSVLQFYSKQLLVSFPNEPDTDYEGFVKAYDAMKTRKGVTVLTRDSVEEVMVSGDLAVVRYYWLTQVTVDSTGAQRSWRARDFTVWRKEEGQWRFFRGMWYREGVAEGKKE